jgi:type I restriction enzyme S subunit
MSSQDSTLDGSKETKIGPIPVEWEVVRLGEVVDRPQYGYTASATEQSIGPRFLRITDIQDGKVSWPSVPFCQIDERSLAKYSLEPGDLVLTRIGATTGKTYLVTECPLSVFASYLIRVRTKPERLLPEYAYFFSSTEAYWRQIDASKGGRLKKGVNIPVITSLLLPLPPLPEQRRIAHVLSTIQRAIAAQDDLIAAARDLKRSLMRHLFTYGPIPLDQADQVPLKETEIGPVPEQWEVRCLGDLIAIASGQIDPRELPYLKMVHIGPEDVEEGTGRILAPKTAEELGLKSGKYLFTAQDVVYSKIRPYLRKVALPSFTGLCSADMYPLRPKGKLKDRHFLYYLLLSDVFTKQAVSHQQRTGIPKINRIQLASIHIPLPSDAEEQSRIADMLDAVSHKIEAEERRKAALQGLFQSMLHQLMTGQLRVPESLEVSQ